MLSDLNVELVVLSYVYNYFTAGLLPDLIFLSIKEDDF